MDRRVKSWINKKIVEYIGLSHSITSRYVFISWPPSSHTLDPLYTPSLAGEEEPSLCGFICSKILAKSTPENILQDVAIVLEEEADVFVVKMWRLLIYETEAKKLGLVK